MGKGHLVTVYNSHNHPYKEKEWEGVQIIHCYDAENFIGTAGQFIYDFNCINNARRKNFDVILFLGYTSSSAWCKFFPENAVIISNMDGMEWKRSKYSGLVKRFLMFAEKLAVKYSDHLIADSTMVQKYLNSKYKTQSSYIAYGAEIFEGADEELLKVYGLYKQEYYMLMARMEPENNIEMILDGFSQTESDKKFIVLGNTNNSFGKKMLEKYVKDKRVYFTGAIFDIAKINTLRSFCKIYFHGHSVGGTNPSLLEAMASKALIAAHNNEFNRTVLQNDAFYFTNADDLATLINNINYSKKAIEMIKNNFEKIQKQFNWSAIVDAYEALIIDCYNNHAK